MCVAIAFHSPSQMFDALRAIGIVLGTIHDLGLRISPSKSQVLMSMGPSSTSIKV